MKHILTLLLLFFVCNLCAMDTYKKESIYMTHAQCCYSHKTKFHSKQVDWLKKNFDPSFFKDKPDTYLKFAETLLVSKEDATIFMRRLTLEKRYKNTHQIINEAHIDAEIDRQEVIDTINDICNFFPDGTFFGNSLLIKIYLKGFSILNEYKKEMATKK